MVQDNVVFNLDPHDNLTDPTTHALAAFNTFFDSTARVAFLKCKFNCATCYTAA